MSGLGGVSALSHVDALGGRLGEGDYLRGGDLEGVDAFINNNARGVSVSVFGCTSLLLLWFHMFFKLNIMSALVQTSFRDMFTGILRFVLGLAGGLVLRVVALNELHRCEFVLVVHGLLEEGTALHCSSTNYFDRLVGLLVLVFEYILLILVDLLQGLVEQLLLDCLQRPKLFPRG